QGQRATVPVQLDFQVVEPNPEVVRVKKTVPLNILEMALVRFRALGRLAEQQPPTGPATRQMTPLPIRGSALGHFHEEGKAGLGKVPQKFQVDRRAEVVGVGNEEELHPAAQKAVE